MKVPISGRVKTSSMASMARRMSVAFFLLEPKAGREDQVDRGFRQRNDVLRVASPVGVGALDRHLALDDVAVEEGPELLGQVLLDAQGDVVEIDQQGCVRGVDGGWLTGVAPAGSAVGSRRSRSGSPALRRPSSTHLAGPGSRQGIGGVALEGGDPSGVVAVGHQEDRVWSRRAELGRVAASRRENRLP